MFWMLRVHVRFLENSRTAMLIPEQTTPWRSCHKPLLPALETPRNLPKMFEWPPLGCQVLPHRKGSISFFGGEGAMSMKNGRDWASNRGHDGSNWFESIQINFNQMKIIIFREMKGKQTVESSKKRYAQISLKKRQILVQSVIEEGKSLTQVSRKLGIKLSTAKLILRKFKATGHIFEKKLRNAKKEEPISSLPLPDAKFENEKDNSSAKTELIIDKCKIEESVKMEEAQLSKQRPPGWGLTFPFENPYGYWLYPNPNFL